MIKIVVLYFITICFIIGVWDLINSITDKWNINKLTDRQNKSLKAWSAIIICTCTLYIIANFMYESFFEDYLLMWINR